MPIVESLYALYLVDQKVRGLESRLDGAKRRVRVQQIKIEQLQTQHDDIMEQLKHTQTAASSLETQANALEERINSLREKMNSANTNKEYSALLVEVNTLKIDKGKLEEDALEQMTRTDGFKTEVELLSGQLQEQQKIKALADKELASRQDEVGEQLEQFKADREKATADVTPEALAIFDRMCETYDGEAMSPVIEENRRRMEYICGGCYMQLPIERVNQLASRDEIVRCTSCSRILYLEKELKASMATGK